MHPAPEVLNSVEIRTSYYSVRGVELSIHRAPRHLGTASNLRIYTRFEQDGDTNLPMELKA